jgi:hypothetical protein
MHQDKHLPEDPDAPETEPILLDSVIDLLLRSYRERMERGQGEKETATMDHHAPARAQP